MSENGKKLGEEIFQVRMETEKLQEKLEDNEENIKNEAGNETEWEDEIEQMQTGEGRRGSDASQSNGCCMDPAFLQHFFTIGADQAEQQLALLHYDIDRRFGMQHQAASVTPVHVPKEH